MRILLLAPQPFYQDRGTPIAVDLLLRILSEAGHVIDVVTYHEGRDVSYPGVRIRRIPALRGLRGIRPGFSWKKCACDLLMAPMAARLVLRERYDVVHAVEESVFIACGLRALLGLPYVYDMDSSLARQMIEKHGMLRPLGPFLRLMERVAVRGAAAVLPVCDALADMIAPCKPRNVMVIRDASLLTEGVGTTRQAVPVLQAGRPLILYVGNLEAYQGASLLLESFGAVASAAGEASLAIVGGECSDIRRYRADAERLGIGTRVRFLGPRPVGELSGWLAQADILVSPRISGENTPMKVYSYLHSGKPVLATRIVSHTQVLDDRLALLAEPDVGPFSAALLRLIRDARLRDELGGAGRRYAAEHFGYEASRRRLRELYGRLERELCPRSGISVRATAAGRIACSGGPP